MKEQNDTKLIALPFGNWWDVVAALELATLDARKGAAQGINPYAQELVDTYASLQAQIRQQLQRGT